MRQWRAWPPRPWLCLDWLSYFGRTRRASQQEYRRQIDQAFGQVIPSPWDDLRQGLVLGGESLWNRPANSWTKPEATRGPLASACGRGRGVASHRLAGGAGARPSRGHLAAGPCGRPADDGTCQGVRLPRWQRDSIASYHRLEEAAKVRSRISPIACSNSPTGCQVSRVDPMPVTLRCPEQQREDVNAVDSSNPAACPRRNRNSYTAPSAAP